MGFSPCHCASRTKSSVRGKFEPAHRSPKRKSLEDYGLSSLRESEADLRTKRTTEKFGAGRERQGLKPEMLPIVYGPTKVVP
jgi:hypothetical protein